MENLSDGLHLELFNIFELKLTGASKVLVLFLKKTYIIIIHICICLAVLLDFQNVYEFNYSDPVIRGPKKYLVDRQMEIDHINNLHLYTVTVINMCP